VRKIMEKTIKKAINTFLNNNNLKSEQSKDILVEEIMKEIRKPNNGWFLEIPVTRRKK